MTDTISPAVQVDDLAQLRTGDKVEARRNGVVRHRGRVDSVAPDLGIVWITEALPGYRRILDLDEFDVWLCADGS